MLLQINLCQEKLFEISISGITFYIAIVSLRWILLRYYIIVRFADYLARERLVEHYLFFIKFCSKIDNLGWVFSLSFLLCLVNFLYPSANLVIFSFLLYLVGMFISLTQLVLYFILKMGDIQRHNI